MKLNPILVVSHPRSGSHFLMTALRQNYPKIFSIQNPYFAIDNLLIPGDHSISKKFVDWYYDTKVNKKIPLIEIKCLHEDLHNFVELNKNLESVKIIKEILRDGIFLNILRDPRECLLSWYKLCKSGGAITFAGSKFRLSNMNYEEFINSSNMHKLPNRSLMEYDATTLDFCAYHHNSWKVFTEKKDDFVIYYDDLNKNYQNSLSSILRFIEKKLNFKLEENNLDLSRPPNAYSARYYRKIGKFIKKIDFILYSDFVIKSAKMINFNIDNLREKIISSFLASSLPIVDKEYKPNEELNKKILIKYNKVYEKYSGSVQTKFI